MSRTPYAITPDPRARRAQEEPKWPDIARLDEQVWEVYDLVSNDRHLATLTHELRDLCLRRADRRIVSPLQEIHGRGGTRMPRWYSRLGELRSGVDTLVVKDCKGLPPEEWPEWYRAESRYFWSAVELLLIDAARPPWHRERCPPAHRLQGRAGPLLGDLAPARASRARRAHPGGCDRPASRCTAATHAHPETTVKHGENGMIRKSKSTQPRAQDRSLNVTITARCTICRQVHPRAALSVEVAKHTGPCGYPCLGGAGNAPVFHQGPGCSWCSALAAQSTPA